MAIRQARLKTRQPVMKKTLMSARSRIPCKLSVRIASKSEMACLSVKDGVKSFCTPGALTAAMSWAASQAMSPLAASCLYVPRSTERRLPPSRA